MNRIELDFFTKVQFPSQLKCQPGNLNFLINRADLGENKNESDLYTLQNGKALRLTSSQDVSSYYPV